MVVFQNAVVAGTGTLALFCAEKLKEKGIPVKIYDMDQGAPGFLQKRAQREEIPYEKPVPGEFFWEMERVEIPTLVVSAINPYILPNKMLDNQNITAINCHQALLPKHPGRNAEMWAIYEGDRKTGITWHMLTEQVDGGDILLQKELEITCTHTAYQVFREQIVLAQEGFVELLPELLAGNLLGQPQESSEKGRLHYSKDLPNGGLLDPLWESDKISAFLRSMDYSILDVVKKPEIQVGDRTVPIERYKILQERRYSNGVWKEDQIVYIQKQQTLFELKLKK